MAVTVEYQAWDSGSYNWLDTSTSTAPTQQIHDKLSTWIAAVNANGSNANKQITIEKGPSSGTNANYVGWVLKFASNSTDSTFFHRFCTSSTTNMNSYWLEGWVDDGTFGGYGSYTGQYIYDSSTYFSTSGVTAEFSIAQDTADGVEFFCLGWRINNDNSQSDCFIIFKDNNGEWASFSMDGGAVAGTYYMGTHSTPKRNFSVSLSAFAHTNVALARLTLSNSGTNSLPTSGNYYTAAVVSANPALYFTNSSTLYGYGRWLDLGGGTRAVCMCSGPLWVVF